MSNCGITADMIKLLFSPYLENLPIEDLDLSDNASSLGDQVNKYFYSRYQNLSKKIFKFFSEMII